VLFAYGTGIPDTALTPDGEAVVSGAGAKAGAVDKTTEGYATPVLKGAGLGLT